MNPKKLIFAFLSAVLPFASYSQNLNPQVVVENTYKPEVSETSRQTIEMSVPDTLHDFDYHFDYTVFESPYKGAYEFSPYSVTVKPEAAVSDAGRFYLKFGAGYTLRPELKVSWTPVSREKFSLTIGEDAGGFYGPYHYFHDKDSEPAQNSNYDFTNHTDAVARTWIGHSMLKADIGYDGFYSSELYGAGGIAHSAYGTARLISESERTDVFHYDFGASYRFVADRGASYHDVVLDGELGGVFGNRKLSCLLDFNLVGNTFYRAFDFAPKVNLILGIFDISLGARLGLDKAKGADVTGIKLYPDVKMSLDIVPDHLKAYVFVDGAPDYNSYFSIKSFNHRFDSSYVYSDDRQAVSLSRNVLNAGGGLKGQISSRLQYDAKAGYRISQKTPYYTVTGSEETLHERILYVNCNSFYADASLQWHSERFDADLAFEYMDTNSPGDQTNFAKVFAPSKYSGTIDLTYNWSRRIYFGVNAEAASTRTADTGTTVNEMPWYVDLGADLQFRINKVWTVWTRGGNLLNMYYGKTPLYRERGFSGIAGVTINL